MYYVVNCLDALACKSVKKAQQEGFTYKLDVGSYRHILYSLSLFCLHRLLPLILIKQHIFSIFVLMISTGLV